MDTKSFIVPVKNFEHPYEVEIGFGLLRELGKRLRKTVRNTANRVFLVSNETVYPLYGEIVSESLRREGFEVKTFSLPDGEQFKNFASYESLIIEFAKAEIDRSSVIVALGGGVIGDVTGFASATFLRGIRLFQVPTTLLSMVDSSVGGKTGINISAGKNMVGAFYPPVGVLADLSVLKTLDEREIRAGFYEMVKHALIGNSSLLEKTADFVRDFEGKLESAELSNLIAENVKFKAFIVSGDAKEEIARTDKLTRKVLNFGHTLAHAIERETEYKVLRHGEAVGYGIIAAGAISKRLELLDANSLQLLNDVVASVGNLVPVSDKLDLENLLAVLKADKKVIDGELQWVLLRGLGNPIIVQDSEIPDEIIRDSIAETVFTAPF